MKRRSFLGKSIAATAVIGSGNWASCLPSEQPLNKKSLKWGMIDVEMSVLEKFQLIKKLGFDGIELNSPSDLNMQEVLDAKEATGIEIPGIVNSLHWSKPLSDPDASVRSECTESMIQALKDCKQLGGTTVLLVPAVVKEKISYQAAWERSTAEIHKMLPTAKETGVKIAIENVWNNFLLSPMEAARYIDQFDSDMIGWYFDVGNIVRYGWPEHWIEALNSRIIKVDIKDYSRKKQSDEGIWKGFQVKLGEGSVNWTKVNEALAKVGYNGWGSAEVSGGDQTRLQEISKRMDQLYIS